MPPATTTRGRSCYFLTMYPYPSGDLHIGHWYAGSAPDAARALLRMRGNNVLFPMGFDAFGFPAENAAIDRSIHPAMWTEKNIERMRAAVPPMGAMFDWSREVITCDPEYYRWNQWIFLQFFRKGLAYAARRRSTGARTTRRAGARAGRGRGPRASAAARRW